MTDESEKKRIPDDDLVMFPKSKRLMMGEAVMWCSECMCRLYSFDGDEDLARKCPHPEKCEETDRRLKRYT